MPAERNRTVGRGLAYLAGSSTHCAKFAVRLQARRRKRTRMARWTRWAGVSRAGRAGRASEGNAAKCETHRAIGGDSSTSTKRQALLALKGRALRGGPKESSTSTKKRGRSPYALRGGPNYALKGSAGWSVSPRADKGTATKCERQRAIEGDNSASTKRQALQGSAGSSVAPPARRFAARPTSAQPTAALRHSELKLKTPPPGVLHEPV